MLNGKPFGHGPFVSSYGIQELTLFLGNIHSKVENLFNILDKHKEEASQGLEDVDATFAAKLHMLETLSTITHFWMVNGVSTCNNSGVTVASYDHTTCFCCLNDIPLHVLQCGHIICQKCVENYSQASVCGNFLSVSNCPLCYKTGDCWDPSWKAKVKPPTAGLRILSLDG
jgi:hypothetical protein